MYQLIRNLYILALITIIIFGAGWYYQHHNTNRHMLNSARKVAELSVRSLSEDVGSWLIEHARTIEAASAFIALQRWNDEDILAYLTVLLESSDGFASIYYGTPEKQMINASGWQPSPGFDLRKRPWYQQAAEQKKTIFTEAFLNASRDTFIITVACPVYDHGGRLLGVVGGDVPIDRVFTLISDQNTGNNGFSFLVDGKGNILAHPDLEYGPNTGLVTLEEKYGDIEKALIDHSDGMAYIEIEGSKVYLAYLPVANTDWYLATYIPLSDFMQETARLSTEFILAGAATLLVFLLFVFYHNRFVHRPLLAFETSIRKIDLENNLDYRLPIDRHNEFAYLGKTINRLLDKAQKYLYKLEENEQSLKKTNREMETLLNQLTTVEEALDYSEEKLYYLSYHDQLTGLYNRFYFEAKLKQLSSKPEYPVTIISADIDGLKLINDTIGHSAGNRLLKVCADIIKDAISGLGIPARVGGDEFSIILPLTDNAGGEGIARQIRYQVYRYNQEHPNLPLSVSIGVATAEDSSTTLKILFKQADDLMLRDKLYRSSSARNCVAQSLLAALAEKDYLTEGHARRLEKMCLRVGEKLGLASHQLADLALLTKVHDLGKVGIPDQVIYKKEPLTEEERHILQQHSEKGYRIASSSPDLAGVADLILRHHEHWDGSGYPLGLKGEEIPIECRILAVVDAFDTMTHERSYKKAISPEEAIAELKRCAGKDFDPKIVEVFLSALRESNGFNNDV